MREPVSAVSPECVGFKAVGARRIAPPVDCERYMLVLWRRVIVCRAAGVFSCGDETPSS